MSEKSSKEIILLVVNPISGDIDKGTYIDKFKEKVKGRYKLKEYRTTGDHDQDKIKEIYKKEKPSRIVVMGGDGTVKMIADMDTGRLPVGIVPLGSSNGLATDLGLPDDIDNAMDVALSERTRAIDTLCINDKLSLHISDMGLNAELIKHYSEGSVRGHFGYAIKVIPTLIETDLPSRFTIKTNGESITVDAVMVAFANSQKFGTGVTVNPNGSVDDGLFEVLIFKNLNVLEVLKTVMGKIDLDSDFVEVIKTKNAVVTTEKEIQFQIDGELCDAVKKVEVSILPQHICIAVGESS